jgi:hypothetical protein
MSTPFGFCLSQYALLLGASANASAPVQFELLPMMTQSQRWQGTALNTALVLPFCPDMPRNDRLLQLLLQLREKLQHAADQQTVYLLLPEFSGPADPQLDGLLQLIMRHWPALLQSERCRIFPYGSAGCLMALHGAEQQLQLTPKQPIWLVAVDTLCHNTVLDEMAAAAADWVLSEGAIALCLAAKHSAVRLQFSAFDATTTSEAQESIGGLFAQVAGGKQRLQHIYLPDCGEAQSTERWLPHYHKLSGVVDMDTAYALPSFHTGELGTAGGLYRLLHILQGYQNGRLHQLTLQFELSARLYRSVALYAQS